jgi:hypothetical protein
MFYTAGKKTHDLFLHSLTSREPANRKTKEAAKFPIHTNQKSGATVPLVIANCNQLNDITM